MPGMVLVGNSESFSAGSTVVDELAVCCWASMILSVSMSDGKLVMWRFPDVPLSCDVDSEGVCFECNVIVVALEDE